MVTARGVSHGVGSLAVLMLSLHVSSSAQNAMRPTIGLSRLGLTAAAASLQVAVRPSSAEPVGTVSVPSWRTYIHRTGMGAGLPLRPGSDENAGSRFQVSAEPS